MNEEERGNTHAEEEISEDSLDTEDAEFVGEEDMAHANESISAVRKLKKQLTECRKERAEYLEGWQRSKADFANARRNEEERVSQARMEGKNNVLRDILPALDSFDMAFSGDAWQRVDETWRTGVEYIYSQLLSALEQAGMQQIHPEGEQFDPRFHESVEQVPTEAEAEDNQIAEVIQKGYSAGDSVIRPARVKVYTFKDEDIKSRN